MKKNNKIKDEELQKQIGLRVRAYRKAQDMTLKRLSDNAGISKTYLSEIERGKRSNVGINTLCLLADALNVDIRELISYTDVNYGYEEFDAYSKEYREVIEEILLVDTKIMNTFYPPLYSYYKVTTFLEFLLYLPLLEEYYEELFADALDRIAGNVFDNEGYICNLIYGLIESLPDSEAKQYADAQLELIRKKRKNNYTAFSKEEIDAGDKHWKSYRALLKKRVKKAGLMDTLIKLNTGEYYLDSNGHFGINKS